MKPRLRHTSIGLILGALAGFIAPHAVASSDVHWYLTNNFRDSVFPSFEISTATMQAKTRNKLHLHSFILEVSAPAGTRLDVLFKSGKFLRPTHTTYNFTSGRTQFLSLLMDWDFDALYGVVEPIPDIFTIAVTANGAGVGQYSATYQVRSINDCVSGFQEPRGRHRYVDSKVLYAAYVDENDPAIDEILHEVIRRRTVTHFDGYHHGWEYASSEIGAIWDVLHGMGVSYSNITTSSGVTERVANQHVRLANDSLSNAEANCVDGSVLMAAIFRKISLRTYLVLKPGHCFLAVDRTFEGHEKAGIEPTMVGSGASFQQAVAKGTEELTDVEQHIAAKQPGYEIVDIQEARILGIQPLRQTHTVNIADLKLSREPSVEPAPQPR